MLIEKPKHVLSLNAQIIIFQLIHVARIFGTQRVEALEEYNPTKHVKNRIYLNNQEYHASTLNPMKKLSRDRIDSVSVSS